MAVPGSGSISMLGIFSEKNEDDYSAANLDGENTLSLRGLSSNSHSDSTGGNINLNSNGGGPDGNTPHSISEFRGYDHDAVAMSLSNHKPQVFRYFSTPSPNHGQTVSTGSALGTVAVIPNSSQSFTGTSTKKGDYTRTNSSINNTALNLTISNESTNSWAIPNGLYNGFQYGITYYSTMWAYASHSNLTVLSGTTEWAFTGAPSVTTQAASSISGGFTMNGNLTGLGLGSSPASGAVHRVVKRGFVYSTTQTSPTYFNATIAENGASPGVFNTGSYSTNVSTTTPGTYYIRAFAKSEDKNTGPVSPHSFYAYGSVVSFTIAQSYNIRYTDGPHQKNFFACGNTANDVIKYTGSFGNGTTVYDNNLNLITNAGWYNGPNTTSGSNSSTSVFYVNSSGVVSNFTLGLC